MKRILIIAAAALTLASCGSDRYSEKKSQESLAVLEAGFNNPPNEARTRVWWHWMNGNITEDGIRKDLEWMDRSGIGGFHHFDAALGSPTVVEKRLIYMHDDWKDAFAYATRLADSLGLEMTVASSPGWSSTGGPWVEPKDAMKKLVWRISNVKGGQKIDMQLPEPFKTTGAFQNGAPAGRGAANIQYEYYEDIVTLAVKLPESNRTLAQLGAKITSSGGSFTVDQLTDGDIANTVMLPANGRQNAWIMYEFPEPQTVRSATVVGLNGAVLECSNDGKNFEKVCNLSGGRTAQSTIAVPATTAKYFRVSVPAPRPQGGGMFGFGGGAPAQAPRGTAIAELDLHTYTRVHRAEDKAAYSSTAKLAMQPTPASEGEEFPAPSDVVDVTAYMTPDGKLTWDAPEGDWKIYRFGWSLTGKQNHPAPAEATGLEVDKLDPVAWTKFFHTYLDMYKDASDGLMGAKGLQYVLTDSYEAEHQTWTPAMFEEFRTRRGYDMLAWMPVLAGEVIGSPEQSDKFLWDWRVNISDLYAANYDLLTKIAVEDYGMLGRYTESHEAGRAFMGDGMDAKRTAAIPMSAMWCVAPWIQSPDGSINRQVYMADDRESASVAHIYGQNIAAAESMTAWGNVAYSYHPANLKEVADLELANGINQFVIHESAHQPSDEYVPGFSLGGIGQWFNRHDSWADMAYTWVDYMSRSSFMLQAGENVADILWYYGEDNSVCSEFGRFPDMPAGYEWDYCSPHALMNAIKAKDGKLVAVGGSEYKLLLMDRNMDYVSVPVLRTVKKLADKGIIISAVKPKFAASLADDQAEFDALVKDIFESGRPNVYVDTPVADVLAAEGIEPDVKYEAGMKFLHRTMPSAEVYWINRPVQDYKTVEVSFRTAGMKPQVWHPDTGVKEDATYRVENGRTVVTLNLVPNDAVFVVFAGAGQDSYTVPATADRTVVTIDGPWNVKFQEKRGAPAEATFAELKSYTDSKEFGIKYFSGIATYTNKFNVDKIEGQAIIDLGTVRDLAEVYVNGKYCGVTWKEPYVIDVTDALTEGENTIEVRVANVWVNRIIGDEQPNNPQRITYCDSRHYRADSPLNEAGLLGPVRIIDRK